MFARFTMPSVKFKILSGLIASVVFTFTAVTVAAPPGSLNFGAYDPGGDFSSDTDVQIEHLFLPWEDVDLASLPAADAYAIERGRSLLVTLEPWTWTRNERNTAEALQTGISNGRYDENVRQVCSSLANLKSNVTLRWGHEMDDSEGQFIWSGWDHETYIAAYRRVIDTCKKTAPNVQYMWSPFGREDLKEYYPGDDYVDVVGLTIFGLQKWDNDKFGRDRTFKEILKPRYDLAASLGKPVIVAELGYVGDTAYVAAWESTVRQKHAEFPALTAVIYFNQKEVYPWPENYGFPDWRVGSRVLN
ncbi:glycoside hydrolase family 26 protein [Ahrensia sp. R2A130]|uniref:glycoside hydrolase family 26 protein n=1 Tax=Ahrensia sp. R2A130 TaxID=744979 RepID=UPI0001E094B4|nr:glycosyl hydrolase [Ahrensia sp. R2A130]EFL88155.1 beta-mannanase [Ahrensia sp. R2A130]